MVHMEAQAVFQNHVVLLERDAVRTESLLYHNLYSSVYQLRTHGRIFYPVRKLPYGQGDLEQIVVTYLSSDMVFDNMMRTR